MEPTQDPQYDVEGRFRKLCTGKGARAPDSRSRDFRREASDKIVKSILRSLATGEGFGLD